ncbi:MAG: hypothetical protein ACE5PV_03290 [Candidatus Poribacteria bacterium]
MITSNSTYPDTSHEFINLITDKFIELHGDRVQGDDKSVCGGLAWLEDRKFILISHRALTDNGLEFTNKRIGVRKIIRLLNIAKQLKRPVLILSSDTERANQTKEEILTCSFIDAIIQNVRTMSYIPVPIIEVLSGNSTIIDSIVLAMADCVIAPYGFEPLIQESLNLDSKAVINSDRTNNQAQSSEISEPIYTVFIDNAQLRQVLPAKIDELMSIPADDLISRRLDRIQQLLG